MKYLEKVGLNARKAFEELKAIKHNKIKRYLNQGMDLATLVQKILMFYLKNLDQRTAQ